jgi:nitroreductase
MKNENDDNIATDIEELIKSRRTINFFQQEPVPDSMIMKAIELARWAPNHRKTEPWHFHIFGEETRSSVIDLITKIKSSGQGDSVRISIKKRLDDIPGWFAISSGFAEDPILQQEDYAACCCAVQNLMLYLWNEGVGVKWTTGAVIRDDRFFELLQIDSTLRYIVGLFWYGYPLQIPAQTRLPVNDISSKLK